MNVRLQPLGPANGLTTFNHSGPEIHIGRDPACELSMDGKTVQAVSWRHARIDLHPHGASVTDLGSTNGTYVNERKIEDQVTLEIGDRIQLGKTGPKWEVVELEVGAKRAPVRRPAPAPAPSPAPRKAAAKPAAVAVDEGPSETRMLLHGVENRQKRLVGALAVASVLLLVLIGGVTFLFISPSRNSSEKVVKATMHSIAWIHVYSDPEQNADPPTASSPRRLQVERVHSTGTGSLIDRKRKLLLTAYHVLGGRKNADIFFVQFDKDGKEIIDQDHYRKNSSPIRATVKEGDPKLDLVVLELDSVPDDVHELPLADDSPALSLAVHNLGNPTKAVTGALWAYNHGYVRQVGSRQIDYGHQKVDARMVMTDNQINSGDSGGPLVTDQGKLVGVCSGDIFNADEKVSWFVDIHEIKALLKRIP